MWQQDTATPITRFANPKKTKLQKSYILRNVKNVFTQQSRDTLAANANIFVLPWRFQQRHNSSKGGFGTLASMNYWGKPGKLSALALNHHIFLLHFQCRTSLLSQTAVSALLVGHTTLASLVTKTDIQLTGIICTLAVGILLVHLQWLPYLLHTLTDHTYFVSKSQNKTEKSLAVLSHKCLITQWQMVQRSLLVCSPIQDQEERIGIYSSGGLTLA